MYAPPAVEAKAMKQCSLFCTTTANSFIGCFTIILEIFNNNKKTEFLKAAIMQSHNCAKYKRICAKFGLMNAKQ